MNKQKSCFDILGICPVLPLSCSGTNLLDTIYVEDILFDQGKGVAHFCWKLHFPGFVDSCEEGGVLCSCSSSQSACGSDSCLTDSDGTNGLLLVESQLPFFYWSHLCHILIFFFFFLPQRLHDRSKPKQKVETKGNIS